MKNFVEDLKLFSVQASHEALRPLYELRLPMLAKFLDASADDVVRVSLPDYVIYKCFENIDEFPGWSIDFAADNRQVVELVDEAALGCVIATTDDAVKDANLDSHFRIASTGEEGFVIKKSDVHRLRKLVDSIEIPRSETDIGALDGVYWDDDSAAFLQDVKFFLNAWKFFAKREIPYTRAYMFYGPPGNGKTSTVKALARCLGVSVETFDFSNHRHTDNHFIEWVRQDNIDYEDLFGSEECDEVKEVVTEDIIRPRIRLLALEDLDRYFPKTGKSKTNISLSAVLNALDGVHPHHNTIIIASANHPENLKSDVLARPGRFDKKIKFNPPELMHRITFMKMLFKHDSRVTEDDINESARMMENQSYAALAELLKSAGSFAFRRGELSIIGEDLKAATEEFLKLQQKHRTYEYDATFSPDSVNNHRD